MNVIKRCFKTLRIMVACDTSLTSGRIYWGHQIESLELIFISMGKTLEELHGVVNHLNKVHRDTDQMVSGGSAVTAKQMHLAVGILPTIAQCLDGLCKFCEMHQDDSSDLAAFCQLLDDQPHIPPNYQVYR